MITNPEALKFVNDIVRPLAEEMRALKARVDSAMTTWYGGVNTEIPNDSSLLEDGREAEGVSRLLGIDINSFVVQMATYKTALDAPGVAGIISKPCVRPLEESF